MSEGNVNNYPADLLERIEKTIGKIRPYIQQDGGDVQLVDFNDGVVTVQMYGACAGCMAIDATLTEGIQAILMDEVPEVKEVKLFDPYAEETDTSPLSNKASYTQF